MAGPANESARICDQLMLSQIRACQKGRERPLLDVQRAPKAMGWRSWRMRAARVTLMGVRP